jgi:hypothetical protein
MNQRGYVPTLPANQIDIATGVAPSGSGGKLSAVPTNRKNKASKERLMVAAVRGYMLGWFHSTPRGESGGRGEHRAQQPAGRSVLRFQRSIACNHPVWAKLFLWGRSVSARYVT